MNLQRSIEKIVKRIIGRFISDVHTHMPCQVVSYDAALNTVSLQPCIKRIRLDDPDNRTVNLPVIEDVPVQQFGSGKLLVSVAPQVGSYGLLHVSERSLNVWLSKGGIEAPDTIHKFDINDGFFMPGIYPLVTDGDNGKLQGSIVTDRVSLRTRTGDTEISVVDDETIQISNASGEITIDVAGQVSINGNLTVDV